MSSEGKVRVSSEDKVRVGSEAAEGVADKVRVGSEAASEGIEEALLTHPLVPEDGEVSHLLTAVEIS